MSGFLELMRQSGLNTKIESCREEDSVNVNGNALGKVS